MTTEAGRRAYLQAHIPGAVYAHLDEDLSGPSSPASPAGIRLPDPETFVRTVSAWGIGPQTQVVVYDDKSGSYAARLWWMLRWMGHEAVAVLDGGWAAWQAEGRPTRSGQETRPAAAFVPRPRPELVLEADAVEAMRTDPAWRLLDARGADRFRGENETRDRRAGHIPGAASAPCGANVDAGGHMLPAEALRQRYADLLGDTPPERTVVYCGSGVTAAHDVLALQHAGLGEARLYAGSWSDWITDPTRPIATGEE